MKIKTLQTICGCKKKAADSVPLNKKKKNIKTNSNITMYSAFPCEGTVTTVILWVKNDLIILLLLEGDQNQSSANLFSGLMWCSV